MKFKVKLRILDKANELIKKQVWAAAQAIVEVSQISNLSLQRACVR